MSGRACDQDGALLDSLHSEEWPDQKLTDEELLMAVQPSHHKKIGWYLSADQREMLMGHIYALNAELDNARAHTKEWFDKYQTLKAKG